MGAELLPKDVLLDWMEGGQVGMCRVMPRQWCQAAMVMSSLLAVRRAECPVPGFQVLSMVRRSSMLQMLRC